jgi:hypothetical protein
MKPDYGVVPKLVAVWQQHNMHNKYGLMVVSVNQQTVAELQSTQRRQRVSRVDLQKATFCCTPDLTSETMTVVSPNTRCKLPRVTCLMLAPHAPPNSATISVCRLLIKDILASTCTADSVTLEPDTIATEGLCYTPEPAHTNTHTREGGHTRWFMHHAPSPCHRWDLQPLSQAVLAPS